NHGDDLMLSKTGFTHSELLCWQIDYAGGSLNVNGTIMRDTYTDAFTQKTKPSRGSTFRTYLVNVTDAERLISSSPCTSDALSSVLA
ncbi:hypothetical protein NP01_18565, partial [Salmonella enterica]|nr:hypothetical protein [Salmonella enterica]